MSSQPSNATLQAAAEWYAVLRAGQASSQEQSRWRTWLDASAENRAAWRYVEDVSQTMSVLRDTPDPERTAEALTKVSQRLRHRRNVLASLVSVLGLGTLGALSWPRTVRLALAWGADYRTAMGQQQRMVLAEGTRMWLNTDTALNVDLSATLRRVTLIAGEVFIETAADPARPFVVDTDQGRLRALGTRFNVRMERDETQLAVFDGAVEIAPAESGMHVIVSANQQVRFSRDRIAPVEAANPARQTWTQGMLLAHDMSLRAVIAELQRYRHGHIGVDDDVAHLRVFGSFPVADTDRALTMLATVLPVDIHRTLPWWINVEARR